MTIDANTFYKLPQGITARTDLTAADKILFAVIANYQGDKDHAFPGVRKLAGDTGLTTRGVGRSIKRLELAGLITVERRLRGQSSWYRITGSADIKSTLPDTTARKSADNLSQSADNLSTQARTICPHKKKRLIKDLMTTSQKAPKTKNAVQTKKTFIKPTVEQLKEEIRNKNYAVDADEFYLKYEANGWLIEKDTKPMKSWKLTLYRWHKNEQKEGVNRAGIQNRQFSTEPAAGETVLKISV